MRPSERLTIVRESGEIRVQLAVDFDIARRACLAMLADGRWSDCEGTSEKGWILDESQMSSVIIGGANGVNYFETLIDPDTDVSSGDMPLQAYLDCAATFRDMFAAANRISASSNDACISAA